MSSWLPRRGNGAGYLAAAWFGGFVLALVFDDRLMWWIVTGTLGMPLGLVAALSWAPFGLVWVLLGLANLNVAKSPVRGGWGRVLVGLGMLATVQLPVAFNRHSSDFYDGLAATPQGAAFIAGAWGAYGPVFAASLVLLTVRWVVNRAKGRKTRFADDEWGHDPKVRRRACVCIAVATVLGLWAAVSLS